MNPSQYEALAKQMIAERQRRLEQRRLEHVVTPRAVHSSPTRRRAAWRSRIGRFLIRTGLRLATRPATVPLEEAPCGRT